MNLLRWTGLVVHHFLVVHLCSRNGVVERIWRAWRLSLHFLELSNFYQIIPSNFMSPSESRDARLDYSWGYAFGSLPFELIELIPSLFVQSLFQVRLLQPNGAKKQQRWRAWRRNSWRKPRQWMKINCLLCQTRQLTWWWFKHLLTPTTLRKSKFWREQGVVITPEFVKWQRLGIFRDLLGALGIGGNRS